MGTDLFVEPDLVPMVSNVGGRVGIQITAAVQVSERREVVTAAHGVTVRVDGGFTYLPCVLQWDRRGAVGGWSLHANFDGTRYLWIP